MSPVDLQRDHWKSHHFLHSLIRNPTTMLLFELREILVRHESSEGLFVYPALNDVENGDQIAESVPCRQSDAEAHLGRNENEDGTDHSDPSFRSFGRRYRRRPSTKRASCDRRLPQVASAELEHLVPEVSRSVLGDRVLPW